MVRGETPWTGGCDHCETITMAKVERLLLHVRKAFGTTRIWLTEFGYQTNPPDRLLGVSRAAQARFTAEAALRAYLAPRVDIGRARILHAHRPRREGRTIPDLVAARPYA